MSEWRMPGRLADEHECAPDEACACCGVARHESPVVMERTGWWTKVDGTTKWGKQAILLCVACSDAVTGTLNARARVLRGDA